MKKRILILLTSCLAVIYSSAAPSTIKTKIVIESVAQEDIVDDAPCFIVYPDGKAYETLKDSGAIEKIEKSISKLGYTIVEKDSDAVVYIRVGFTQHESYSKEFELKHRDQIDYSNSVASSNMAATHFNGRYKSLANPTSPSNTSDPGTILGPTGEVIHLGSQSEKGVSITEGGKQKMITTIYPITFQVSAWIFSKDEKGVHPQQLWGVLASYNNLRDEEAHPQLLDMSKAASRYFGKQLKKEKRVER